MATNSAVWKQSPPPPAAPVPLPKPTTRSDGSPFGPPQVIPKPVTRNDGTPFGTTAAVGSQPLVPPTGGAHPQVTEPFPTATQQPTSTTGNPNYGGYVPVGDEAQIGLGYLDQALSADSALMRNARTTGIETAASRGLQNSSIAAGAAQRAALDAAMPIAQQSMDTFNQREQRQWTGDQQVLMANIEEERARAQREWTASQNQLDRDQQLTMAEVNNWLATEAFNREFNAQLATMPINNAAQLMNFIAQQAITNPEIYTPDIISGMSEFFNTNFLDVMSRYFPNYFSNTGGQS